MVSKFTKANPEKFTVRAILEAKRGSIPSESSTILPMSNYQEMKIGFDVKIVLDFNLFSAMFAF